MKKIVLKYLQVCLSNIPDEQMTVIQCKLQNFQDFMENK